MDLFLTVPSVWTRIRRHELQVVFPRLLRLCVQRLRRYGRKRERPGEGEWRNRKWDNWRAFTIDKWLRFSIISRCRTLLLFAISPSFPFSPWDLYRFWAISLWARQSVSGFFCIEFIFWDSCDDLPEEGRVLETRGPGRNKNRLSSRTCGEDFQSTDWYLKDFQSRH